MSTVQAIPTGQQQSNSSDPSSGNNQTYISIWDFQPEGKGALQLKRGDIIRIINHDHPIWWKG